MPKQPKSKTTKKPPRAAQRPIQRLSNAAQAQDLMSLAYKTTDPDQATDLASRALELDPECSEAYTILADCSSSPRDALRLAAEGSALSRKLMGEKNFRRLNGMFWQAPETRGYMLAHMAMSRALWALGQPEKAIGLLKEMLKLNPRDDQGARYNLMSYLLAMHRDDECRALIEQYPEKSVAWNMSQALLAFRKEGDTENSRRHLAAARRLNKHIIDALIDNTIEYRGPRASHRDDSINAAYLYYREHSGSWRNTPGAASWLRRIVAQERPEARKGPALVGPTAGAKSQLKKIKQVYGRSWEVGIYEVSVWWNLEGSFVRPWATLIVSPEQEMIVARELSPEPPMPEQLFDMIASAIRKPAEGKALRPAEIQVRESPLWDQLRPHLEEIGVDCINRKVLAEVDSVFDHMSTNVFEPQVSAMSLLDIPGMTNGKARAFYASAADYYRAAPWRYVPIDASIIIECDEWPGTKCRRWSAAIPGHRGAVLGLGLADENLRKPSGDCHSAQGDGFIPARTLFFSEIFETSPSDDVVAAREGWSVAAPEAYPTIAAYDGNADPMLPKLWEVELIDACLLAIPQFVRRHDFESTQVETITVHAICGPRTLKLSWDVHHHERGDCGDGDCGDCDTSCSSGECATGDCNPGGCSSRECGSGGCG
jgi:tetratricopeptide (TPR) repeat protein